MVAVVGGLVEFLSRLASNASIPEFVEQMIRFDGRKTDMNSGAILLRRLGQERLESD